jgi:hypothetical protein
VRSRGGEPSADEVGELALRGLRSLDPVAYVRFASVYRKFGDIAEFEAELARLDAEPPLQREHLFEPGSIRPQGHTASLPPEPGEKVVGGRLVGVNEGNSESRRRS